MDYKAHYERLISRARSRVLPEYKERHHVIPKCMGARGGKLTESEEEMTTETLDKLYLEWSRFTKEKTAKI